VAKVVRITQPGEVPTAWQRPRRSTVISLLLVVIACDGFLLLSGSELDLLDARIAYGPALAERVLGNLAESERAVYRAFNAVDLGFIAIYSTLFVTWLRFFRQRGALPPALHPVFGLLPGLFDFLETSAIAVLLRTPTPTGSPYLWVAALATPLKWLGIVAVLTVIAWGEARWWRARRARRAAVRQVWSS